MLKEDQHTEFKSSFGDEVIETLVAFANSKGGKVIVGLDDRGNPIKSFQVGQESLQNWINQIKTKTQPSIIPDIDFIEIEDTQVVDISIQEYPIKPVSFKGRYYKRVKNSNHQLTLSEISDLYLKTFNTSWDYHTNNEFRLEDISLEKVEATIQKLNLRSFNINDDPFTFLIKSDLVRNGKLSNAAYLMFKDRDSLLTTVELGRFQTEVIIKDSQRTQSDVITQVGEIMDFVKKHINKEILISGKAENEERWQYPLDAIREIILNKLLCKCLHKEVYVNGNIM